MASVGAYYTNPTAGNPQVVQSQVVLNADFDRYYLKYAFQNSTKSVSDGRPIPEHLKRGAAPDCFNLMPREMCFTIRNDFDPVLQRSKAGLSNPRDLRIFSSANYMPILMNPNDFAVHGSTLEERKLKMSKIRHLLRSQVSFVGVPLTKVLFDENLRVVGNDKVPIQISGSTTIWNTGPFDIHPGDLVLWDVPWGEDIAQTCRAIPGLPVDKKSFWTVPMRLAVAGNGNGDDLTVSKLTDVLVGDDDMSKAVRIAGLGTDTTFKEALKDFQNAPQNVENLKSLLYLWNVEWSSYTSRVIGRALKGASPGMAFDIMIQRAH